MDNLEVRDGGRVTGGAAMTRTEERVTLHGLGFLQLQLPNNTRLHIWHPALPRRYCVDHSSIHDHRFGFRSIVLVGTIENRTYAATQVADEVEATHASYLHEGPRTRFGNRPWIRDQWLAVTEKPSSPEIVPAGQTYNMMPYVYHASRPLGDGRVATLMAKTEESPAGAHSLCRTWVKPDADFDRKQWPEANLWDIVRDVLGNVPLDLAA
jgi:hypothetical protein